MRFFAIASSSAASDSGMPGSKLCTTTSSRSSGAISRTACVASTLSSGRVSCTTQPARAPMTASRKPYRFISAASLGVFLVLAIFLPELFLQLRIRLGLGRLAQPPGNDVVVLARGNGPGTGTASAALRHRAAPRCSAATGRSTAVGRSSRLARALHAFGLQVATVITLVTGTTTAATGGTAAPAALRVAGRAAVALARGLLLLMSQLLIEFSQRRVELSVDLRPALGRRLGRQPGVGRSIAA